MLGVRTAEWYQHNCNAVCSAFTSGSVRPTEYRVRFWLTEERSVTISIISSCKRVGLTCQLPPWATVELVKVITRIRKVTQESRFLNWTEHGAQLLKRRRRRRHFITLVFCFILLSLLFACFNREFLKFVQDIWNQCAAIAVIVLDVEPPIDVGGRHLLIKGSTQSMALAQIDFQISEHLHTLRTSSL